MPVSEKVKSFLNATDAWTETGETLPAIFIGHGAPLYALGNNKFTEAWRRIGQNLPTPRAIVSISAHWLTPGKTLVTATPKPKTIHDFGGFDQKLYEMQYPAPGSPDLAREIVATVDEPHIGLDHEWGYDHGTWCVLYHMFPKAEIPVIQLSIDYSKGGDFHFQLGEKLRSLRKKGVLLMASGNIVHNLRRIIFEESRQYDWAIEFDQQSKALIDKGDYQSLVNYAKLGSAAQLSIPTPDHYWPLIYALGLTYPTDVPSYPVDGVTYGSTSMRSVVFSKA